MLDVIELVSQGSLSGIAPTMLTLMDVKIPEEMNGRSLVNFAKST